MTSTLGMNNKFSSQQTLIKHTNQSNSQAATLANSDSLVGAVSSQVTLMRPPPTQKRGLGVMGYADELFEMRVNQNEMKQYKRNMVSS